MLKFNLPETAIQHGKKKRQRDELHGTGITKRLLQQADRDHATFIKTTAERIEAERQHHIDAGDTGDTSPDIALDDHVLPDSWLGDDITLDEYQQTAVDSILWEKYACLIGAAGTGKTTTVKAIIRELEGTVPASQIAFCAYTGKAVQQMKRAIPLEFHKTCDTIHGLLGYHPEYFDVQNADGTWRSTMRMVPTFTASNLLPHKILVMDESGMTPVDLWNVLVEALRNDCRIILIGDINQLPPPMGRSVLGFAMLKWPTFELKEIHRTALDNPIIAMAHRVLAGRAPMTSDCKRFIVKELTGGSDTTFRQMRVILQHLHKIEKFNEMRDGFIVPQNVGPIGQTAFNEQLVMYFNPPQTDEYGVIKNPRAIVAAGRTHASLAVGDKVMLLKNIRTLDLTNGMMGVVTRIVSNGQFSGKTAVPSPSQSSGIMESFSLTDDDDVSADDEMAANAEKVEEAERQASHITTIKFQNVDKEIDIQTAGEYAAITHAYAFTCHKAQGSEFPTVIVLVHSANMRMLCREWLYTAITRAQQSCYVICNSYGMQQALNRQRISGKTLEEKAQQFIEWQESISTTMPLLPEASAIPKLDLSLNVKEVAHA